MSWQTIWKRKGKITPTTSNTLSHLIKISGFDTGVGQINHSAWRNYVNRIQAMLEISSATTVSEIGCGAGAFLYPLYEQGVPVTGADYSDTSIAVARKVMPDCDFYVSEANQLPYSDQKYDVALCSSVFHYFPNFEYAKLALKEIVRISKSNGKIAILDLPDLAKRDAAERYRQGELSPHEYKRLYADYQHLYYDKSYFQAMGEQMNLTLSIFDQDLPGYGNAPYRFNVIFTK